MSIPRDNIAALVATLSGVQVEWVDDAQYMLGSAAGGVEAWLELAVLSYAIKGTDEYRQKAAMDPNFLTSEVTGYRMFTLSIIAHSFDTTVQSYDLLELVRWGLRTVTAQTFYAANGIAFVRTHPINVYRTIIDNRTRLDANMDVVLATLGGALVTDDPGQTIGEVNTGGVIPGP